MAISWANASEVHAAALQRFVCTTPSRESYDSHRGRHHPAPHELEVQSRLRGQRLPRPDDEVIILALEDGEVAGAAWIGFDPEAGDMRLLAIAVGCAWQGKGLGGEILDVALDVMLTTRVTFDLDCAAFAYIHPDNERSQALFRSREWVQLGTYDGYQGWVHDLAS